MDGRPNSFQCSYQKEAGTSSIEVSRLDKAETGSRLKSTATREEEAALKEV